MPWRDSASSSGVEAIVYPRYDTGSAYTDQLRVRFHPDWMVLDQKYNNTWTTLDTELAADTANDTWYDVYVKSDGANVEVWRAESGEEMTQVLSTSSAASMSTTVMPLWALANSYWAFDDFAMLDEAGEPIMTYTYTVNNANELTAMSDGTTTTNFTYDDWGRQTSKYTTSYDADYEYRYGHKLTTIESTFPGQGISSFTYVGNGARRATVHGNNSNWYNYGGGKSTPICQEADGDGTGSLSMTFVGGDIAILLGDLPESAPTMIRILDHLGTLRQVRDGNSELINETNYTPFGETFDFDGDPVEAVYAGQRTAFLSGLLTTFFRAYDPQIARWLQRDPLGMIDGPNLYEYVLQNPIQSVDELGLFSSGSCHSLLPGDNMQGVRIPRAIPRFNPRIIPRPRPQTPLPVPQVGGAGLGLLLGASVNCGGRCHGPPSRTECLYSGRAYVRSGHL